MLEGIIRYCSENVYLPSDDTYLLSKVLIEDRDLRDRNVVLEIGSGSGYLSCIACKHNNYVVAIDLSLEAVECSKRILDLCECSEKSDVVLCDSASCLRERSVEAVFFNPPYLPEDSDIRWSGGVRGIERTIEFLKESYRVVRRGGVIVFLTSTAGDLAELLKSIVSRGGRPRVVRSVRKFFEILMVLKLMGE